jgi:WD40 repeat protein
MGLNSTGTLVATCGYDTTKIWEVSTGRCIVSSPNLESRRRPFTIIFTNDDTTPLVGFEDSTIQSLDLRKSFPAWEVFVTLEEKEIPGHFFNSPSNMALNKDGTRLVVACRGHSLAAWKLRGGGQRRKHSGYLWRRGKSREKRTEVEDMVWHPHFKLVLGVYIDGSVFK